MREFYGPFAASIGKRRADDGARQGARRADRRDLRTVRPSDGHQVGRYRTFHRLHRLPGVPNAKPLLAKIGVYLPRCGQGDIVERRTKKGRVFFGCSRYPDCTFTTNARPTGVRCPACGGVMVVANRAGTESKCQTCGHRELVAVTPVEPERVAQTA